MRLDFQTKLFLGLKSAACVLLEMRHLTVLKRLRSARFLRYLSTGRVEKKQLKTEYDAVIVGAGLLTYLHNMRQDYIQFCTSFIVSFSYDSKKELSQAFHDYFFELVVSPGGLISSSVL